MKKQIRKYISLLSILLVLAINGVGIAAVSDSVPANTHVDWITGTARTDFIHYKEKVLDKVQGKSASNGPACYKTFAKWPGIPVNYVINPANSQGLTEGFVTTAISTSAETWDSATINELFNPYSIDYTAQWGVSDNKNTIDFGTYDSSNVIAVTSVWYNFFTKQISEADIRFNTAYFQFGDASISGSTVMDLQDLATHEIGHVAGLDDIYKPPCSPVTMYGYSSYGETYKRTLETPDITGLRSLYG